MWNAAWIQSMPTVAMAFRDANVVDAALDLAVWFAACAAVGAALAWLRELARRSPDGSPTGPRLLRGLGAQPSGTLLRA
ncbi:hypothetical protein K2Z84_03700 [Candidatus Binatia bacterium]|jgi:hypothetical protein|nr:hypothetical protein [Candidatus Binatia bacterium]